MPEQPLQVLRGRLPDVAPPSRLDERWRKVRRLLVVRLDNLGDVLLMTPAFRALKRALPQATLTLLASPVGAQVGALNPDLDEIIVYEAPWVDPWARLPHDSQREEAMIRLLRERRFDGAIIFTSFRQSALPAAYLCYLADIPLRLAASSDGSGSLLTTRLRPSGGQLHEVERALELVAAIGVPPAGLDLVLAVPEAARQEWRTVLTESGLGQQPPRPLIVVHPGCSMPARTYPWELFSMVIEGLVAELGATVCLTGAEHEKELVERIHARVAPLQRQWVLPLAGRLSFAGLCALIEGAAAVVTNNTGPMHIAAALGTAVVALFALTNPPEQWRPWRVPYRLLYREVPCRLCYQRLCPYDQLCLRGVRPAEVVTATATLLAQHTQGISSREQERERAGEREEWHSVVRSESHEQR
ncbi:glycosyltransferase family 9 protein [Thermogemmatispora sp.]|uniref:glycosyltransferase family 9 protein n=1 Tax=Thermogemmatispora sp. TaxID=1968838 RepID=UPI0035E43C11